LVSIEREGLTMTRVHECRRRAQVVRTEACVGLALALMAVCATAVAGESGPAAGAEVGSQTLDLESRQVHTHHGVLNAVPLPGAFVGAVDERLFIGVVVGEPEGGDGRRMVRVYLCDSDQVSIWLSGPIEGYAATFEVDEARVALVLDESTVSGTVILAGGEAQPFSAVAASDAAGLYRAEERMGETIIIGSWIVLHDHRQRGVIVFHEDDEQQDITYLLR
jgi:hypothetical protein